ncbi:MAG: O-methyltransferase [Clostridium sp.]|nr:O-methyltransferase [Clostridium sp.]
MDIDDYICSHISEEPAQLRRLYRDTHLRHLYPRMCSGHAQGRLLKMLTEMIRPQRIIELGTFTGYSALCMAEGMPVGAELHTIEIDDEMSDELRATFDASPRAADIHLHIGDALEVIPALPGPWNMAFIDANKRHYCEYLQLLIPRMAPGAFILADNTLWDDKILDPAACRDPQTKGIAAFNDMVASDPRLEKAIIPIRDGLTLIRVL